MMCIFDEYLHTINADAAMGHSHRESDEGFAAVAKKNIRPFVSLLMSGSAVLNVTT